MLSVFALGHEAPVVIGISPALGGALGLPALQAPEASEGCGSGAYGVVAQMHSVQKNALRCIFALPVIQTAAGAAASEAVTVKAPRIAASASCGGLDTESEAPAAAEIVVALGTTEQRPRCRREVGYSRPASHLVAGGHHAHNIGKADCVVKKKDLRWECN